MYWNEFVKNTQEMRNKYEDGTRVGFYDCMRRSLLVCRWAGLLPISGLSQSDSRKTRTTWNTSNTLLYVVIIFIHLGVLVLPMGYGLFKHEVTLDRTVQFTLALLTLLGMLALIPFCNNWNKTLKNVEKIEQMLPPLKKSTVWKINSVVFTVVMAGTVEHISFQVYQYKATITCFKVPGDSGLYLKSYVTKVIDNFPNLFNDYLACIIFEWTILLSAFIWIFSDVIIINVSMYLVDRFQEFNAILNQREKELSRRKENSLDLPWPDVQQQYTQLMKLVNILDKNINPMVFLSYTNLILIGRQMFLLLTANLLKSVQDDCIIDEFIIEIIIYYCCSSLVLLMRISLVSYWASRIHTLSRRPLEKLYTIPAYAYDWSFQRFIDQVFHSNVCLSGMGCFFITRKMILSVLASLLTYELVMLQNRH